MFEVQIIARHASGFEAKVWKWFLDTPHSGNLPTLETRFSGWILCTDHQATVVALMRSSDGLVHEIPVSVPRQDVIDIEGVEDREDRINCGFDFQFSLGSKNCVSLGFRIDGEDFWVRTFEVNAPLKVIEGSDGFLFLDNDTNCSVDQFKGNRLLGDHELDLWSSYLKEAQDNAEHIDARLGFLIAPSKEEIFPDKHPFERGKRTTIDQFLEKFPEVLYPIEQLTAERDFTYSRTDTHWTDYGALLAAKGLLARWCLPNYLDKFDAPFNVKPWIGDLGSKLRPYRHTPVLVANHRSPGLTKTFQNKITNHGRLDVYENRDSATDATVVIFGGSSSFNFAPILAEVFRRVVSVYTGGAWVAEVVKHELPEFILIQTNQRFLIHPPTQQPNFWEMTARKIGTMAAGERLKLDRAMRAAKYTFSEPYANRILDIIRGCG